MRSLRDFLHPVWRDAFKSDRYNDKTELNQTVLDIFDEQLQKVEDDTIASKAQSFLGEATDEWLDYWGSWFGLKRDKGQDDEEYRKAIINHVKHARDTIPALRDTIAKFLKTNVSNVQIYEPWKNVFILNDSDLNGYDHFYGSDYYNYGIIDIQISVPFPPEVVDIINWFRPAGVVWVLTYNKGASSDAPMWVQPPAVGSGLIARATTFYYLTGLDKEVSLSLNPNTKFNDGIQKVPFILNDSYLNSMAVLLGAQSTFSDYYNSIGSLNGLVQPQDDETISDLSKKVVELPSRYNYYVEKKDEYSYPFKVSKDISSYKNILTGSFDMLTWSYANGTMYSTEKTDIGSAIVDLATPEAELHKKQYLGLLNGKTYTVSFDAKQGYSAPSHAITIFANIDKGNSAVKVTNTLDDSWKRYSATFTYRGNSQEDFYLYTEGDFSVARKVSIANVQIELGEEDTGYSQSERDFDAPLESDYTYVYAFLDVRSFFYDQVQSEGAVKSAIDFDDDPKKLNSYMDKYLEQKHIQADYDLPDEIKDNVHTQLMVYNFTVGTWVNFRDDNVMDHATSLNFKLPAMDTYMNNQGVMAIVFRTTTLDKDFDWRLNDVQLAVTKTYPGEESINIYSDDISTATELYTTTLFHTKGNGDTTEYADESMYDKFQQYYPVRYIRNTIGKVHLFVAEDNINKTLYLNRSLLNSGDKIADPEAPENKPADKDPYSLYQVQAQYNAISRDLPLTSMSILGASTGDSKTKNLLGNLLQGGVFSTVLENKYYVNNDTVVSTHTDYNGKRLGQEFSCDSPTGNGYLTYISENTFKQDSYRLSFSAKDMLDSSMKMKVKVILHTNDYKYATVDKEIELPSDYKQYSFDFDTQTIFANKIEIQLIPEATDKYDFALADTDLRLNVTVTVDGQATAHKAPSIVPDNYPARGAEQEQADISTVADSLGTVSYDSIVFDDTGDRVKYQDGIKHLPLLYGDEVSGKLSFDDLDSLPASSLPDFQKITSDSDITQEEVTDLLSFLKSYQYHLEVTGDSRATTYKQLLIDGTSYLTALGFQVSTQEHTVTIDLGKIRTDIKDLLVHHGSDSNLLVEYDNILQTSVDGVNWTTWYNNYKKPTNELSDYYIEPQAQPKQFRLPTYNVFQQREDLNKGMKNIETINGVKETLRYVSAVPEVYPALGMAKLALGDFYNSARNGLLLNSNNMDNVIERYKPTDEVTLISPAEILKRTSLIDSETTSTTTVADNSTETNAQLNIIDLGSDISTDATAKTASSLETMILDDNALDNLTTTTTVWWTTTTSTTSTTTVRPTTTTTTLSSNLIEFRLGKSLLNGRDVLSGTDDKMTTTTSTTTVNPTDPVKEPTIEHNLVIFDTVALVTKSFPDIWDRLGVSSEADKVYVIKNYFTPATLKNLMSFDVLANSLNGWSVSIWNGTHQGWELKETTQKSQTLELVDGVNDITDYINGYGLTYLLVSQDTFKGHEDNVNISDVIGYLNVTPRELDSFKDGLYPHRNLAMSTNYSVSLLGRGSGDPVVARMYTLKDEAFNHKVRVSFNVVSSAKSGAFDIDSTDFEMEPVKDIPLEAGNQHYSFVINLPAIYDDIPSFTITLHDSLAYMKIFGFKVEYGADESPYVQGAQSTDITTTTTNIPVPSEDEVWQIENSLNNLANHYNSNISNLQTRTTAITGTVDKIATADSLKSEVLLGTINTDDKYTDSDVATEITNRINK